jgi:hypothetical protein
VLEGLKYGKKSLAERASALFKLRSRGLDVLFDGWR